jgi:hypothetical protein
MATTRDERLFVDRTKELAEVEKAVNAKLNVLMLSPRGGGKTSFLHHLARRLERRGWHAAFVEGGLASTPTELLSLIRARLSPAIQVPGIGQQLGAAAIGAVSVLGQSFSVARRIEGSAGDSQLLLETITAIANDLKGDERPHVVLLDEVSTPELVHTVFGRLRDEIWQLPVVWVVAGDVGDRNVYLRPPADAFFTRIIMMDAMDAATAFKLLRRRIPRTRATDGLLKAIIEQSTLSPRDLLRLASDVVVGGARLEQLARSRAKREELLETLGEPAQRVVAQLEANGPASASDDAFLNRLGFGRSRAAQIFGELERLGIVEASTDHSPGERPRKVYSLRRSVNR